MVVARDSANVLDLVLVQFMPRIVVLTCVSLMELAETVAGQRAWVLDPRADGVFFAAGLMILERRVPNLVALAAFVSRVLRGHARVPVHVACVRVVKLLKCQVIGIRGLSLPLDACFHTVLHDLRVLFVQHGPEDVDSVLRLCSHWKHVLRVALADA